MVSRICAVVARGSGIGRHQARTPLSGARGRVRRRAGLRFRRGSEPVRLTPVGHTAMVTTDGSSGANAAVRRVNESMSTPERRSEAAELALLGAALLKRAMDPVLVEIPVELAAAAEAAWARDDDDPIADDESIEDELARTDAGTLALIGLAIEKSGESADDGAVAVALDPGVIGAAVAAAQRRLRHSETPAPAPQLTSLGEQP